MLTIILKKSADQKPSTLKPDTIQPARLTIAALITKRNNPMVRIVIGMVKTVKTGLTNAFSMANAMATIMAVINPSTCIPGNTYAAITTATAVINKLIIFFLII